MRIAVHDYAGFSFPLELSRELSKRGHSVLHLFSEASGGPKASCNNRNSQRLQIVNIDTDSVEKDDFLKRWLQERRYGALAIKELNRWQPDVIISGNTPLEAQKKIIRWAGNHSVPSIFWLHDLLSIAARSVISNISRSLGCFVYNYMNKIEIYALQHADRIVSITEDFIPFLNQWNIDPSKVSVIPNWGPIEQIPVLPRNNQFSERNGLNEKFVILYCGTLGKKQGIQLIADTAAGLIDDNEIIFVVATDDRGHRLLNDQLAGKTLSNLIQLPLQPSHLYPFLLASSDVTLVTIEASAGTYCVPSKLWSAYCAQKASVVAVDRGNLCARITEAIHAGIVVTPGSVEECISAVRKLKKNRTLRINMGKNARDYAERHFPISRVADSFEAIIHQVAVN
ncbi:glycosyltransferase family 4 protein [uncultured Desulfosarcina sp.]|uniref:glycosyltransferase family 4 protein n=1 Tax=uncultured Desulfosarcina sp. TaxID=218289 RepID=UPI0029C87995|nr:glycosyltransferase family 4 protein [uncultured Desulfosarcina sp.]